MKNLFLKKKQNNLKSRLIEGAIGTFGLRITYTGLTFIISILLARILGASEFGVYNYVLTWASLLAIPGTFGLSDLLVREIAIYKNQSSWDLMKGMLLWSDRLVFVISVGISLLAVSIVWHWKIVTDREMLIAFSLAMISVPMASLRDLRRGAIRGLDRILLGFLPEMLFSPLMQVVLTISAYLFLKSNFNASWVIGIYDFATIATLSIAAIFLNRNLPNAVKEAIPDYEVKKWLKSALPFMWLIGIYFINSRIDVLMLGSLESVEAAGIYVPVNRAGQLITFVLMAVSSTLSPTVASLYADGQLKHLQDVVSQSARGVFIASSLLTMMMIVGGYWYLLLFGSEFISGQTALNISCIGQAIYNWTGLSGVVLSMTGNERYMTISGSVSTLINIVLNALLIPQWGIEGACFATAFSTILMNVMNAIELRKKLHIYSFGVGKLL